MSTTLTREPVQLTEQPADDLCSFKELAKDAKQLLDYSPDIGAERKATSELAKLQQAMRELDIQPFRAADVERYKKAEAKRASSNIFLRHAEDITFGIFVFAAVMLVGSVIGCLAASTVPGWLWLAPVVCVAVIVTDAIAAGGLSSTEIVSAKWKREPLGSYSSPIPEFALQTAVDLKRRCPIAEFYVDELTVEKRVLDPFLVVRCGGQQYFLEVWNEPRFQQKRSV